jgi:hypothetical protein
MIQKNELWQIIDYTNIAINENFQPLGLLKYEICKE